MRAVSNQPSEGQIQIMFASKDTYMAIGMAIGVGIGIVIGTVFSNTPIGIAIGISLGAAIATIWIEQGN